MSSNYRKTLLSTVVALSLFAGSAPAEAGKYNMSYVFHGSPGKYIDYVETTRGSLDVISPSYFKLNPDGSLQLSPSLDPGFIQEMHKRNIRVVPYLSNDWNRDLGIRALQNKEHLADQLAEAIHTYQLDGINIDLENIPKLYREDFTALVQLLRARLPADKEVSVAVAANPYGSDQGWLGLYDYEALAEYSDHLMIMAYDEHYEGDLAPGSVASWRFIEKSIEFALSQVPADKIVLGFPFYGRLWKSDGTILGISVQNRMADELIKTYRGTVTLDPSSRSARATFTVLPTDPALTVNGRKLSPGDYELWYENEAAMKLKLELVGKYHLKGAGSWSLAQEDARTWDFFRLWLNGAAFPDSMGHWAHNEIADAYDHGWMNGEAAGIFSPDGPLTRAQAVTVLSRIMMEGPESPVSGAGGAAGDAALSGGSPSGIGFADVTPDHWAAGAIAWAYANGIVDGIADGSFAPDEPLTREQMTAMLARLLNYPPVSANTKRPYADVAPDRWSHAAIQTMSEYGVVDGYPDGTFRPEEPVTRAQMAVLMTRGFSDRE